MLNLLAALNQRSMMFLTGKKVRFSNHIVLLRDTNFYFHL